MSSTRKKSKAGRLGSRYACFPSCQSHRLTLTHSHNCTNKPEDLTLPGTEPQYVKKAQLWLVFRDKLPHSSPPQLPSCARRITTLCPQHGWIWVKECSQSALSSSKEINMKSIHYFCMPVNKSLSLHLQRSSPLGHCILSRPTSELSIPNKDFW